MKRLAVCALLALAACSSADDAEPRAGKAWARLPAVAGRPAAAYVTVRGGRADDRLTGAWSAVVERIELHESGMQGGMMTMRALSAVAVPAGQTVTLAPGGNHMMLFGVDPRITPGTGLPLQLRFASGKTLEIEAKTVGAGDPAPEF